MNLKQIIDQRKNDNLPAIIQKENIISYKELYSRIYLNVMKITKEIGNINCNIGLYLNNSINFVVGYFTSIYLEKIVVPFNISIKSPELNSTIIYSDISLIITDNNNYKVLIELIDTSDKLLYIYNLDTQYMEKIGNGTFRDIDLMSYYENGISTMLHTSGTTSKPKKVMLTHKGIYLNFMAHIQELNIQPLEKSLVVLPMNFSFSHTSQMLAQLYLGGTLVIMEPPFLPTNFLNYIEKYEINESVMVPALLMSLTRLKSIDRYNVKSLKRITCGGATMPYNKWHDLFKLFPLVQFVQTYGLSEASPRVSSLLHKDILNKPNSVGRPLPGITTRIIDVIGEEPKDQVGQLLIKSQSIMAGYYKDIINTEIMIDDEWLKTGDLARIDEDGYIYIVGRLKNIINYSGTTIYPEEIEELLLVHPLILDAYVFGEANDILGEIPIAHIVLNTKIDISDSNITEEIRHYLINNLDNNKVPKIIKVVNNINRSDNGKIIRR
jgi:long-chain acyl-CoA synthetase